METPDESSLRRAALEHAVERAAGLLPAQGPIGVFVHHNTLHAFEHLPFEQAVVAAGRVFGAKSFLDEEEFRGHLRAGRVDGADIDDVLRRELGAAAEEPATLGLERIELRRLLMVRIEWEPSLPAFEHRLRDGLLPWSARDDRCSDEELWQRCSAASKALGPAPVEGPAGAAAREALARVTEPDAERLVMPLFVRVVAAMLDQGVASWPSPGREQGVYGGARELLAQPFGPPSRFMRRVAREMRRQRNAGFDARAAILDVLDDARVEAEQWESFIVPTLLALPGWFGIVRQLEVRPDRAPGAAPPARLMDALALRLTLDREAWRVVAEERGLACRTLAELASAAPLAAEGWAHREAQELCHLLRVAPDGVAGPTDLVNMLAEIRSFPPEARRRCWQLAYERHYRQEVLGGLAAHLDLGRGRSSEPAAATFQAIFCIDERSESLRRHLEEVAPACRTLGTAGFFGVAMAYRGIDDGHAVPLCPVVLRPLHEVVERRRAGGTQAVERRAMRRRWAGRLSLGIQLGSRTFVRGALVASLLGTLAALPLVIRVLVPRTVEGLRRRLGRFAVPRVETTLDVERQGDARTSAGLLAGYSRDEMADVVVTVLSGIGLTSSFAPLVLVVGHGSSSLNNPHESAHDCGACGGGRGGPNARAFALMANHPDVRARLERRGIAIPATTWFLAAYHDTCDDAIGYLDMDSVPPELVATVAGTREALEQARRLDAQERCRRFDSAPIDITADRALRHVEGRAVDLAQPRPEYGHATNALCVVGRRALTRGLFLDRRAFLASYDPDADPGGAVLGAVLASVVPVGAGINLEYYFSRVDPVRYGCGTKLPHNISGLVGVMDGHRSDLRTGLPWQMVEIHEPVRLLTIIEASAETVRRAMEALPGVRRLVENRWVQLATVDPVDGRMHVFEDGVFAEWSPAGGGLAIVARSHDWYRGRRGPVAPARVAAPPPLPGSSP